MTVMIIDDKQRWDEFIDRSPYGLLFHKWDFLKIMEKHTGYRLLPYGVYKGEEQICAFPFFYKKIKGVKLLYSPTQQSLTYVPYLGPVLFDRYDELKQRRKEAFMNMIVDEVNEELSRLSPNYLSIALVPGFIDVRPFKWSGYDADVHFTYFIDLKRPIEEIWKSLSEDCRKGIRKCEKANLRLEQVQDIDVFYDIMRNKLSSYGVLYFQRHDTQYLSDVMEAFPGNVRMYFLYRGDDVAALFITCEYKKRYMLWMGGAVMQKENGINDYFIWELIKKAKAEGYNEFENWGADLKRLNRYKSKFNPSLGVCFMVHKKDSIGSMAELTYGGLFKIKPLNFIIRRIY